MMLYVAPGEGCLPNRVLAALGRGITKVVVRNRLNKFWLILSARTLMTCLQGGVMFNESEVYLLSHFTSFEVSVAPRYCNVCIRVSKISRAKFLSAICLVGSSSKICTPSILIYSSFNFFYTTFDYSSYINKL